MSLLPDCRSGHNAGVAMIHLQHLREAPGGGLAHYWAEVKAVVEGNGWEAYGAKQLGLKQARDRRLHVYIADGIEMVSHVVL
jgi:hypothetical protein